MKAEVILEIEKINYSSFLSSKILEHNLNFVESINKVSQERKNEREAKEGGEQMVRTEKERAVRVKKVEVVLLLNIFSIKVVRHFLKCFLFRTFIKLIMGAQKRLYRNAFKNLLFQKLH